MNLSDFISKLEKSPEQVTFDDTMSTVDTNYSFSPTFFENGNIKNEAGENSGSCKLFAFAKLNRLTKEQTLHCFGEYYRHDVLKDAQGDNHQNIRNFIKYGWKGVKFEKEALKSIH
ncbi:HopJ type III effector protein [Reichenbachiella versicolor]|uniref:HopJ type III effector protein n=1 Tax=Reichenbachiella versicolor TaxID=1821036 RepID=UPI000D6EA537|nr:HopJ type III effector protein [Reichenbachiella versicolor]